MKARRPARAFVRHIKWRVTLALAFLLAIVIVLSLFVSNQRAQKASQGITVFLGNYVATTITSDTLGRLSAMDVFYEGDAYSTVPLQTTLEHISAMPTLYEDVLFIGESSMMLSGESIAAGGGYIAFGKDGEALSPSDGGPFSLIWFGDGDSAERLENLSEIQVLLQE